MIGEYNIDKLRSRGLIVRTTTGEEAVRVTAQCRKLFANTDYATLREAMQDWQKSIAATFSKHGGEVVPGSLSVLGQTIELLVPAKEIASIDREFAMEEVRLDLVQEWNATIDKKL